MLNQNNRLGFFIRDKIGNNQVNKQEDIKGLKSILRNLDYYKEDNDNGYITKGLDQSIRRFQIDNALKVDGRLYPGGETEQTLRRHMILPQKDNQPEPIDPVDVLIDTGVLNKGGIIDTLRTTYNRKKPQPEGTVFMPVSEKTDTVGGFGKVPTGVDTTGRAIKNITPTPKTKPERKEDKEPLRSEMKPETPEELIEKNKGILNKPNHTIDDFINKIINEEGNEYTTGKVYKDAIDPDGPSKIGISEGTLIQYKKFKNKKQEKLPDQYTKNPKEVTPELARQIYDEMYYKRYNIDKIKDKETAGHILDITILNGNQDAAKWYQEELNEHLNIDMKVDGVIGPETREAIEKAKKNRVLDKVKKGVIKKRMQDFEEIVRKDPKRKGFLKGWLDRADQFKD